MEKNYYKYDRFFHHLMINVYIIALKCNGAINLLNYVVSISNTPFLDKIITPVALSLKLIRTPKL